MAQQPSKGTTGATTNNFSKGLSKDINESFQGEGVWSHARNAVTNSHDGNTETIQNEPANLHCIDLPYTLIGAIPLSDDEWWIATTDDTNSEIGIFDESKCSYRKIGNSTCLGFKRTHLITGVYRNTFDCGRKVYFADGLNPDRCNNVDNPEYKVIKRREGSCYVETKTKELDCEAMRLAPLLTIPKIKLRKGKGSGTLPNGSYQVTMAYTVNQIKVTDYIVLSEVQPLFDHLNLSGSLVLDIQEADQDFDEFELVIISTVNQQTVAKRLGIYSTHDTSIYIDTIASALPTVPLNLIPLRTPAIEKSDSMYSVNNYLLRVGIYSKPEFNYQLQANNIKTKWVSTQYPADYYSRGGIHASYMRDENYPFFIRWIHNTGDKSASYSIVGRAAKGDEKSPIAGADAIELVDAIIPQKWQVYNTATVTGLLNDQTEDGGLIVAEGEMGYWESTEKYPDTQPEIWGDLCGKNIRHHKFPDNTTSDLTNHYSQGGEFIYVLGVKFEGITHPLDNAGNPVLSVVGYEILRGSREGQKTVIAKGLVNNLREYDIPGDNTKKGLFQNYPYNDLRPDTYLTSDRNLIKKGGTSNGGSPLSGYTKNIFSFHSPETSFSKPFLALEELKIYQETVGTSLGSFETPYKHPKMKALTNFTSVLGSITGIMSSLTALTSGISIEATDDLPVSINVPAPKIPELPPIGGGIGGLVATAANYVLYAARMVVFATSVANVIALSKVMADSSKAKILALFYTLAPKVQFALQYNSQGSYDKSVAVNQGNIRRKITAANYIDSNIQSFANKYRINNLNRSNFVALEVQGDLANPSTVDNSRALISEANVDVNTQFTRTISSYYGALKISLPSQYGQIDSIKQIVISNEVFSTLPVKNQKFKSGVVFGGDVYINRFTEKNSMFFFNDWLFDQPDEFEFDYRLYTNVPYPRFWMDSTRMNHTILNLASDFRRLDKLDMSNSGWKNPFFVKSGFFYLFNSGIREFFVESEVNIALRDWEEMDSKRHYDRYSYTDINMMFRSDIIKSNNFYKYDYSLSNTRIFNSYISWGNVLPRDYDPSTAESCYAYYPKRIMYSLPQELELKKDNWKNFLANNYKDFSGRVTSIKPINKTGALIMMRNESPIQLNGVDTLQTDAGTKITIGDGGLFSQSLQNITNADKSYQYGSCQNRYAVAGTPYGLFYMSQDQGKIFCYSGQLEEISKYGNKYWFANYLPSFLLKKFPDYPLSDNPVVGIGCQVVYDNTNDIVYFTKRDFKPINDDVIYDPEFGLGVNDGTRSVLVRAAYQEIVSPGGTVVVPGGPNCKAPIDLVFILDTTGSMGSVINNMKNSMSTLATTISDKSDGDYRIGLISANEVSIGNLDNVVLTPLSAGNNIAQFQANLAPVFAYGGAGIAEPTDVCLESLLNNTPIKGINPGTFRENAVKMIILITDAPPSGLDDRFSEGVDDVKTHALSVQAASMGIKIYSILTGDGVSQPYIFPVMQDYANTTGGQFYTSSSGVVSDSIADAIENVECPPVTIITPPVVIEHPAVYKQVSVIRPVELTDPNYFEDASWTMSYDPKDKSWISPHDWHPNFLLPGKSHFMAVMENSIWKHNQRCDLFCNFFGKDYPFEVEFISSTGQNVTTMKSIEYMFESYEYQDNCHDKFHTLDNNFDRAIVYNSEQISGMLKLFIKPKNNPRAILDYPKVSGNGIDILYSKEENKYRFNQFYDVTKDRGEFSDIPRNMFITKANGYVFQINPSYVNYSKPATEHKRFRHTTNKVFLRKIVSGNQKLIFKLANVKNLNSPR